MTDYITVAKVGSVEEGQGITVEAGGRLFALFLHNGQYYAIDDMCPHQGASLGAGHLDEDGTVSCPWHAWRFRVCDGTWCDNPRLKVDTYEVRVKGDEIQMRLSG